MSIAQNFPTVSPALSLDFAAVQALDPRITFARAATATYYGTRTAKAEENLIAYSQEFDNAYWTKANITVSANNGVAPDGTTTAELIYPNSTGTDRIIYRNGLNGLASTIYTYSFFAKANGINWVYVGTLGGGTAPSTLLPFFDLQNGVVGQTGTFFSSASITAVGSGWYRCVVTGTSAATLLYPMVGLADGNNTGTVTASGTNGVFVWGAQLEQRSTVTAYTPTTTQPITNYIPILETAASGVARFDHNPLTFESLGLLIEEQRTNLLLYSEQFNQASFWNYKTVSVVSAANIAPSGAQTAQKIVETATNSAQYMGNFTLSVINGAAYTWSIYAKAAERNWVNLRGANFDGSVWFNLSTGTIGTVNASAALTGYSITSVGNGWYRCSVTYTASNTTPYFTCSIGNADNSGTYTGNGYSGIFIWGAQIEAGAFSTSYIPTVASQVTRAADIASMTGTNFSSWYREDQGSFYAEVGSKIYGNSRVISLTNAAGSRLIDIYSTSGNDLENFTQSTGGATTVITNSVANSPFKVALAYKVNDWSTAANGVQGGTSATTLVSIIPTTISIGAFSSARTNGTIKKLSYYPLRLSNTNLQALTG